MTINDRMKEIRIALNLSQERFGQPLGLTKTSVSSIENNLRVVSERTILLLHASWKVSETWLRTGEGEMFDNGGDDFVAELGAKYNLNAFQQNLVRIVYDMPPAYQEMILTLARRLVVEEGIEEPEPEESDRDRTARIARAALADYDRQQEEEVQDKRA